MSPNIDNTAGARLNQLLQTFKLTGEIVFLLLKILWAFGEAFLGLFVRATPKSVKGEVVLITGAGHGIGRELALQYAAQEAVVVCWDINQATNNDTVKEIAKLGYPKAHGYVCDVTRHDQVLQTARKVLKEVGDVTILINNAGVMPCHSLLDHPAEELIRIMNLNVMAHFWTLKAFLPTMIKNNQGHVVAIASLAAFGGLRNIVPYATSKFAIRGLMETLFQELRVDPNCRIKTTTIYPFGVDTGLCKKPVIRFTNLLPMLDAAYVAKCIVDAQRCNVLETGIPSYYVQVVNIAKMFLPTKAFNLLIDFLGSYPDSDL